MKKKIRILFVEIRYNVIGSIINEFKNLEFDVAVTRFDHKKPPKNELESKTWDLVVCEANSSMLEIYNSFSTLTGNLYPIIFAIGKAFSLDEEITLLNSGMTACIEYGRISTIPHLYVRLFPNPDSKIKQGNTHLPDSQKETHFELLFDESPFGIVIIDPDTQLPVEFNTTAHEQLGYTREEFAALRISDYEASESLEETRNHVEKLLISGWDEFETNHKTKSGEVKNIKVIVKRIDLSDKFFFYTIYQDITNQKRFEKEILFHARLLNNIHDAVIATDLEFNILSWNSAAEQQYGYSRIETVGKPIHEIIKTVYLDDDYQNALRNVTEEGRWSGEVIHFRKDGSKLSVHSSVSVIKDRFGKPIGYVGVNRNISEQKNTEKSLREIEAYSNAIVACSPVPVLSLDLEGNVLTWNDAAEKTFGWTFEEVVGKPLPIVPDERKEESAEFRRRVANGEGFIGLELIRQKKDGSLFEASLNTAPIFDDQGHPVGIMAAIEDISDRKKAESQLRESEESYRKTLNALDEGVIAIDIEGRITRLNPKAEMMIGWTQAEAIGLDICKVIQLSNPSSSHEIDIVAEVKAAGGESVHFPDGNLKLRHADILPVSLHATPVTNETGDTSGTVVVLRDKTEEIKAQKSLFDQKNKLTMIFDATRIGAWEWNIRTGECIYNGEWAEMLGYDLNEIKPDIDAFTDLIHPDDLHILGDNFAVSQTGKLPFFQREIRMKTKSSGWKWILTSGKAVDFDLDGKATYAIGIHQDIDERKRIESELLNNEAQFRAMVEGAPDAIFIQIDKKFAYLNKRAASFLGAKKADDLIGKPVLDIFHPDYHQIVLDRISNLNEELLAVEPIEELFIRVDGKQIWGETNAHPINYHGKNGALVFIRDIAERKEAERKIRDQFNELQRWYKAMIGREKRNIELKQEVNQILIDHGKPPRYQFSDLNRDSSE